MMTLMPLEGAAAPPRADGACETKSDTTRAAARRAMEVRIVSVRAVRCPRLL